MQIFYRLTSLPFFSKKTRRAADFVQIFTLIPSRRAGSLDCKLIMCADPSERATELLHGQPHQKRRGSGHCGNVVHG